MNNNKEIIEIENNIMNDLVNYGFKSFKNHHLILPIEPHLNNSFLDTVKSGDIPVISFKSKNSTNQIDFYVTQVNSEENMTFGNISLKTNYFILENEKYTFYN